MNIQTILILAALISLVLIVRLRHLLLESSIKKRLNRRVSATITDIRVEASSISSWWILAAAWQDPKTGQTLVFRKPHLQFPPENDVLGSTSQ